MPEGTSGHPPCLGMGISTTVPAMRGQGMGVRSSHQPLPAKCSPRVRLPVYVSQHGPGMNRAAVSPCLGPDPDGLLDWTLAEPVDWSWTSPLGLSSCAPKCPAALGALTATSILMSGHPYLQLSPALWGRQMAGDQHQGREGPLSMRVA